MEPPRAAVAPAAAGGTIAELRALALSGLERMYDRSAGAFVFCVRKSASGVAPEGLSDRYTAITALGLAGEDPEATRRILAGDSLPAVVERLIERLAGKAAAPANNLGDLALAAWAGHVTGCPTGKLWDRIVALDPVAGSHPTVEVAWTLSAATIDRAAPGDGLGARLAQRLQRAFASDQGLFPHHLGAEHSSRQRSHVSCFADLVYPTLALAQFGMSRGDLTSIRYAAQCADRMCRNQGPDGQWWWHFDYRTGRVLEGYPVYAVHQTSMAPMALLAAADAARMNYDVAIARGLDWLQHAPELGGRSLIDRAEGLIWRKVARREPRKLSRYLQAAVSRISPDLRAPALFPPTAIDYEDRPYHLGWVLYAWPAARAARWPGRTA
jgi:hypothetical protein